MTRFWCWLRCRLGLHEGDISCDLSANTVSYSCRFCPYTVTDPISPQVWRDLDRAIERRTADAHANAARHAADPGDHAQPVA